LAPLDDGEGPPGNSKEVAGLPIEAAGRDEMLEADLLSALEKPESAWSWAETQACICSLRPIATIWFIRMAARNEMTC
jgi:hypothetical protein